MMHGEGSDGRERDRGLGELIILANERFDVVRRRPIRALVAQANAILHGYSRIVRLSADEDLRSSTSSTP
jgi:hypothetical protein